MDADQLAKARRAYDALDTLGFWLPLAWTALVLLTLLLARRRLAGHREAGDRLARGPGAARPRSLFARDTLTEDLPQRDVALAVWDVVIADLRRAVELRCRAGGDRPGDGRRGRNVVEGTRPPPGTVGGGRLRLAGLVRSTVTLVTGPRHASAAVRRGRAVRPRTPPAIRLAGTDVRARFPPKQQGPHLVLRLNPAPTTRAL